MGCSRAPAIVDLKAQRSNQMECYVRGGACASHTACILRNLRADEDHMKVVSLSLLPARRTCVYLAACEGKDAWPVASRQMQQLPDLRPASCTVQLADAVCSDLAAKAGESLNAARACANVGPRRWWVSVDAKADI